LSHQAILAEKVALEALGTWWHVSPARQSGSELRMPAPEQHQAMMQRHKLCLLWMCVVYKALVIPRRSAYWIPCVVDRNVSLELWLGIGVKHMTFLELWLGMTSLELWLGMPDEHEELLSCGSGWRVLPVWVCMLWCVRWIQIGCRPWYETNEFGSLKTLWMLFVLGTPLNVTQCGP